MEELIESFLKVCEAKSLSLYTIASYKYDLTTMAKLLEEEGYADTVNVPVDVLLEVLRKHQIANTNAVSIRLHGSCREFWRYLNVTGVFPNGYADFMVGSAPIAKVPAMSELAEIKRLKLRADNLRDKCVLDLLVEYAVKPSEICDLKYTDYDKINKTLNIGGTPVELNKGSVNNLNGYISEERRDSVYLFTSRSSEHLSRRTIQDIVDRYSTHQEITCNSIRNTVAINKFIKEKDFIALNKFLRHKSMKTTGVFLDRFRSEIGF